MLDTQEKDIRIMSMQMALKLADLTKAPLGKHTLYNMAAEFERYIRDGAPETIKGE